MGETVHYDAEKRRRFSYPPDFWGPRHHDCVGDGGGQSDERGDVDGAAGPFWFNSILSWRQVSLRTQSRAHHVWFWATGTTCRGKKRVEINNSMSGLTGRLQGLLLTFTHRLGGKWSSCGQLVSDKQNLEIYINADVTENKATKDWLFFWFVTMAIFKTGD